MNAIATVTRNCSVPTAEGEYLFWKGETFDVLGLFDNEVEVKTRGEYVYLPRNAVRLSLDS